MFFALARGRIDTGPYRFQHELLDIETLNRRAFRGELELTAVSVHAYPYVRQRTCCARAAPAWATATVRCWSRRRRRLGAMAIWPDKTIAVPGTLTTAYLTLRLCLGGDFRHVVVPFDQILACRAPVSTRASRSTPG